MSWVWRVACVLFLAASAQAAAVPSANVILITVDTTRADRMGFMGSRLGLTPNLDALAHDAVVFTRAYSQAPLTAPSHATILTGTYPQYHQVNNFGVQLAENLPYAPAILQAHGYQTAAVVGAMALDPKMLAPGFDRGFLTYDADFGQGGPGADRYHAFERRAEEVVSHALTWLNEHPQRPFFLWVHVYDPHDPYDPPEPYKSKYASAPYNGEIAYADSALGRFLNELRKRGLYNEALIALMADHGEALGDHGEETHGFFLYDETIHVPLLIKLPANDSAGKTVAGKRIETRVGLVDVMPTILQAVGIEVPQEVQGQSLVGMMKSSAEAAEVPSSPDRQSYAESDYGHDAYGWSSLRALRTGKYLYVRAPRQELYDQTADPHEEHNLFPSSTAVGSTLGAQLDAFREKTSNSRELPRAVFSPEAQQKLAALGYVASDPGLLKAGGGADQAADPKDKIATGNLLHRANMLREDGRCRDAVPLLRQVIAQEPGMAPSYMKLGQCLMLMNDYAQAVPVMRKFAELNPESADAHFQLGAALVATEDFAGAVPELEYAVAKVPRFVKANLVLANAYTRTNRLPEAIKEYNQVLETNPDDYIANLLLGRVLLLSGEAAAALPKLKKAAILQPKAPEPHQFLSNAYLKLGQDADAAQEQIEARQLAAGRAQ
ncbi:MAG: sulfatase-like hydrolase/transferase [Terriglobales bacterium]|jgi:choline-sulfatase